MSDLVPKGKQYSSLRPSRSETHSFLGGLPLALAACCLGWQTLLDRCQTSGSTFCEICLVSPRHLLVFLCCSNQKALFECLLHAKLQCGCPADRFSTLLWCLHVLFIHESFVAAEYPQRLRALVLESNLRTRVHTLAVPLTPETGAY